MLDYFERGRFVALGSVTAFGGGQRLLLSLGTMLEGLVKISVIVEGAHHHLSALLRDGWKGHSRHASYLLFT